MSFHFAQTRVCAMREEESTPSGKMGLALVFGHAEQQKGARLLPRRDKAGHCLPDPDGGWCMGSVCMIILCDLLYGRVVVGTGIYHSLKSVCM